VSLSTVQPDLSLSQRALTPFSDTSAYEILNYNQQLVQFADAKAGNLIVINSLFIAAAQAGGVTSSVLLRLLQGSLILTAGIAVLVCLLVIMSQANLPRMPRKDFIFFGDITQRKLEHYVRDYHAAAPADLSADALRRTYVLALIARRKFASYAWAQAFTVFSALLWLLHSSASVFIR
jgi:hypothetical protein